MATEDKVRKKKIGTYQVVQIILGVLFGGYVAWRLYEILIANPVYGPDTWLRFAIAGIILGSVYALVAIGYTLVYGILHMINFAHGDIMMIGAFGGYFVFEGLKSIPAPTAADPGLNFLNAYPVISVILAFVVGVSVAALSGYFLERIAYRPLRSAPRLVPLISAIGASIFLENAAMLMFGAQRRDFTNPTVLTRGDGWELPVGGGTVILTYTGVLTFVLSIVILVLLYLLVQRTRMGRAMRAVAENKNVAALMGINVDGIISFTFAIGASFAALGGVLYAIAYPSMKTLMGVYPGLKAFIAAVLGGIGSIPGAFVGALIMGQAEALTSAYISTPMRDAVAFSILILVLLIKPTGIFGEPEKEKA